MRHRRDPRRQAGERAGPAAHRRRRVRVVVPGRHRQRHDVRRRALRGAERPPGGHGASTRTTRRAARCAGSARRRCASPTRRRWTSSPTSSASTGWSSGGRTRSAPGRCSPPGRSSGGARRRASCIDAVRGDPAAARGRPRAGATRSRSPAGAGNVSRGEALRRGVGFAVGYKNIAYSEGFDDTSDARVTLERGPGRTGGGDRHARPSSAGRACHTVMVQIAREELGMDGGRVRTPRTPAVGFGRVHLGVAADVHHGRRRARGVPSGAGASCSSGSSAASAGGDPPLEDLGSTAGMVRRRRAVGSIDDFLAEPIDGDPRCTTTGRPTGSTPDGQGDSTCVRVRRERAVVEVDIDLGLVRVVQIAAAQDVGRALNPQGVHGQIEGGTAQGLGLALMEEVQVRDGVIRERLVHRLPDPHDPRRAAGRVGAGRGARAGRRRTGRRAWASRRRSWRPPAVVAAIRDATGRELNRSPV